MRNTIREWRGVKAEIRWREYPAAAILGYTLEKAVRGSIALRATVVLSDAYKLAQRPLTLVLPVKIGKQQRAAEIVFPIESFVLRDGALTATLGPQVKGSSHAALPVRRPDPRSPLVVVGG